MILFCKCCTVIIQEPKEPGELGIRQIKELLLTMVNEIFRCVDNYYLCGMANILFSDEDDCEDAVDEVMKDYNLDLYEVSIQRSIHQCDGV